MNILKRRSWEIPEREATPEHVFLNRRQILAGMVGGGVLADFLKQRMPTGRIMIGYIAVAGTVPLVLAMVYTESLALAFFLNFLVTIPSSCWVGVPPSTASDLVMPRMRAVASAVLFFIVNAIGLGLGPTLVGVISDALVPRYGTDSLRYAIVITFLFNLWSALHYWLASRHVRAELGAASGH